MGTRADNVRETPVVGLEGLSPDDIRDSQVKFVEIVLEGVTESVNLVKLLLHRSWKLNPSKTTPVMRLTESNY